MNLQHVLQRPDIWRGSRAPAVDAVASGFAALDRLLPGGGWPRGAITEIQLPREGVGELRLLLPALASLSRGDRWIVFVAPPYIPFAPALAAAGVELSRLLLVHPRTRASFKKGISEPTPPLPAEEMRVPARDGSLPSPGGRRDEGRSEYRFAGEGRRSEGERSSRYGAVTPSVAPRSDYVLPRPPLPRGGARRHECTLNAFAKSPPRPSSPLAERERSRSWRADHGWTVESSLRSRACAVTLAWADAAGAGELRRWQLAAEAGGALGILFQRRLAPGSPAALQLRIEPAADHCIDLHIVKRRGGWPIGPVRLEIDRALAMREFSGTGDRAVRSQRPR